jgi:FtsH-binding integral membrane protein
METERRYLTGAAADQAMIDVGLRDYMLRVYNYMASGLALTGLIAYVVASYAASVPEVRDLLFVSPLKWVIMLAPVGLVFFLAARVHAMSFATAQLTYWVYAGLMGVSLASLFMVFTGQSIARVFFITAGAFAALSLYGYTTKRDLSGFGTFLYMGLIGIVIASIVNIFLASAMMHWIISIVGVGVFVGLTAYDTQRIKETYYVSDDGETAGRKAIMGALQLYLDFINLFVMLIQLLGDRK